MTLLGWTEETDSLFPCVRLLDLIGDDKWRGEEKFMAVEKRRLYLKRIGYEIGSHWSFSRLGVT